jgi:hypothetical protein
MDTVEIKNEVLVPQQNSPVTASVAEMGMTGRDIEIPRILLMQGTSELVGADEMSVGDLVSSADNTILAGIEKPLEIVPVGFYKTIRVMDMSGGTPKFKRLEPWTEAGEALPWEMSEGDIPVRRYLTFNFYVLLKEEIEAGIAFPYILSFKSSSLKAGRQLATHIFKRSTFGKSMYSQSVPITVRKEKKGTNFYAVMSVGRGTDLRPSEQEEAKKYAEMLKVFSGKVHEDQDEVEAVKPSGPSVVSGEDVPF